jgi:hypothetical protein
LDLHDDGGEKPQMTRSESLISGLADAARDHAF